MFGWASHAIQRANEMASDFKNWGHRPELAFCDGKGLVEQHFLPLWRKASPEDNVTKVTAKAA